MKKHNLTDWALNHKQFVYYIIFVVLVSGMFSYQNLGRMEYPDFTIRQMVVSVAWPGSSALQVEEQVTDKIEKKLQNTPGLDYLESCSRPGQSIIYVYLKDTVAENEIRSTWFEVRNMVNDISGTLPTGIVGPYFNDRFDDVYGNVYAITGDGYSYEEMRVKAEAFRQKVLQEAEGVKRVELIGVQDEKIYVEAESSKLSNLGIDPALITSTLQAQNSITPAGKVSTSSDDVYLRVTGVFDNLEEVENLPIRANGETFRLGDIAKVTRSYEDPESKMYYNGVPAVGIGISMEKGGNVLTLEKSLEKTKEEFEKDLPAGLTVSLVANQPEVVKESINEFIETLALALIIVLIICFASLGLRSGLIVAISIPLVICGVFSIMYIKGIALQQISLGALIIALGLLVDDAIISIEMISVKLEEGWERPKAASFAYSSTALPRLTGALITCAAFTPVFLSKGNAAEFVGSIFVVVSIALLLSWLAAGTIVPMLGERFIKIKPGKEEAHDVYDKKFYRVFRGILEWCLNHRKAVIIATVVCFVGSLALMANLKQEFFPSTARPELIVDLTLPEGTAFEATELTAAEFAKSLEKEKKLISHYTYYVGEGAPRFVLTFSPSIPNPNMAQFVIVAKDKDSRIELEKRINKFSDGKFPEVSVNTRILQAGPGDVYPVSLRVTGTDIDQVQAIAKKVEIAMISDPNLCDVSMNWNQKNKVVNIEIDQDKARALGVYSQSIASTLQTELSGYPITEFREGNKTVSIVLRQDAHNIKSLSSIKDLNIRAGDGNYIPLDQVAKISYDAEFGMIWKRDLKPTITVRANTVPEITGNTATQQAYDNLESLRSSLPESYRIDIGGPLEMMKTSLESLAPTIVIMILIIVTLLMIQLQDMRKMLMALMTAPLGLIGVSLALFFTGSPMGFVVILGILALMGITMRNSVILIDQIDQELNLGETKWNAIINATVKRLRPIMLTAAAAILGMVPLATSVFWGPMAIAIAGGLFIATVLTLMVLPVIYASVYRAKPSEDF